MKLESNIDHRPYPLHFAPLIDTIGLLLIFFLLGSHFTLQSGVNLSLPNSPFTSHQIDKAHLLTIISEDPPLLLLNEKKVELDSLPHVLAQLRDTDQKSWNRPNTLIIYCDKNISYGFYTKLSTLILQENFSVFNATLPPQN